MQLAPPQETAPCPPPLTMMPRCQVPGGRGDPGPPRDPGLEGSLKHPAERGPLLLPDHAALLRCVPPAMQHAAPRAPGRKVQQLRPQWPRPEAAPTPPAAKRGTAVTSLTRAAPRQPAVGHPHPPSTPTRRFSEKRPAFEVQAGRLCGCEVLDQAKNDLCQLGMLSGGQMMQKTKNCLSHTPGPWRPPRSRREPRLGRGLGASLEGRQQSSS